MNGNQAQSGNEQGTIGTTPNRQVLDAMMEELGTSRLDFLPLADRLRNAPGPIRNGLRVQSTPDMPTGPASQNRWTAAVQSGAFDDADAEAVRGLDPLGGPRAHKAREHAGQFLDSLQRRDFERPQDYARGGSHVPHGSHVGGRGNGQTSRREQPPRSSRAPILPMGAVHPSSNVPVRQFSQNRINIRDLATSHAPVPPSAQPRNTQLRGAKGLAPSSDKGLSNEAKEIRDRFMAAMSKQKNPTQTRYLTSAQITANTLSSTVKQTISEPLPSSHVFSTIVGYLHRGSSPTTGHARLYIATAPAPNRGVFFILFSPAFEFQETVCYYVANVRQLGPVDNGNHRLTIACKKEPQGLEDLHPVQFKDASCMSEFLTTLNRIRSGEPVAVNPPESVTVFQTPSADAITTSPSHKLDCTPTKPKASATKSQTEPNSAPHPVTEASPDNLISSNTPSPRRTPRELLFSLDSSPDAKSPKEHKVKPSATQDLANLEPWFEQGIEGATSMADVGRLANDFGNLTISPGVECEMQVQGRDGSLAQAENLDTEPKMQSQAEDEPEDDALIQAAQAEIQADPEDKAAPMRRALTRLEEGLLVLFQMGGLSQEAVKDTMRGIKQAVVERVRPMLTDVSYFGHLTEFEKLQVLQDFLGDPVSVDEEGSAFESRALSHSSSQTDVTSQADALAVGRIEYTHEQLLGIRPFATKPPSWLYQLEFLPLARGSTADIRTAPKKTLSRATSFVAVDDPVEPIPEIDYTANNQDVNADKPAKNTVKQTTKSIRDLASCFKRFKDGLGDNIYAATNPEGDKDKDVTGFKEEPSIAFNQTSGISANVDDGTEVNVSGITNSLDPAAANFTPVTTTPLASPVIQQTTLAAPTGALTKPVRGLGSSRWATQSTFRVTNEGQFTGIPLRTSQA